jgi:hypothetical protein
MIRLSSSLTSSKYIFHISESFSESAWPAVASGTRAEVAGGTWAEVAGGTWAEVAGGTVTWTAVGISIVMQGPAATLKINHAPTHHQHCVGMRPAAAGRLRAGQPSGFRAAE